LQARETYCAGVPGPLLLVNPRSGDRKPTPAELCRRAEGLGIEAHVLREDEDAADLARSADATALGIAGGDGSLGAVAAVAIERDLPFACIPFGTRNHFARDVGLHRDDPVGTLAAFAGRERRVDVGRVADRVFLNNVSLGAYAQLVQRRGRHRRRREVLANARALGIAFREPPLHARVDGEPLDARILLVANNHYTLELLSLGERKRLDDGLLHLYAARGVLPRTWHERTATALRIELPQRRVETAIDGELETLETPLDLRLEPRALRVLLPVAPHG
jgi:diacylglycerol kinase family enzyme